MLLFGHSHTPQSGTSPVESLTHANTISVSITREYSLTGPGNEGARVNLAQKGRLFLDS